MSAFLTALKAIGRAGRGFSRANADEFARAVASAAPVRKGELLVGDMLTKYTPEEYALMRTFLSPDKLSGYALKGGDELVSVFSVPGGRGKRLAQDAVLRGARRLDNYDVRGKLPELYGSVGFRETARYPFDPALAGDLSAAARAAEPQYVEMAMDPRVAARLAQLRGAGQRDLERILAGGAGRLSRRKNVQNATAAAAALATLANSANAESSR